MDLDGYRRRPAAFPRAFVPVGLGLASAALLLALRAAQQSADALEYAGNARQHVDMVHPHHVLFVPAVRAVLDLLAAGGRGGDAILAGQLHNTAWAIVALLALRALVARFTDSPALALGAALGLLFTRGFWVYATRVETYVPALAALLLSAWLTETSRGGRDRARTLGAAVALALAMLYHQTSLLFVPPLFVFCLARHGRAGWRPAGLVTGVAALLTLGCYLAAYRLSGAAATGTGFTRWTVSYAAMPVPAWGSFAHFGAAGCRDLAHSQAVNLTGVPARLSTLMVPAFALAQAALVAWHARALGRPDRSRPLRLLALAWLGVHGAFFLWWLPSDVDFFVVPLAPLVLLAALLVGDLAPRRPWCPRIAVVAVGVLAIGNFAATVWPLHASPGAEYARAARLHELAPGGYAIGTRFGVRENLCYHFGRTAIDLDLPLLWAFAGRDPAATRAAPFDRILVPVGMLAVDREVGGRSGRTDPQGWSDWLCWLLGARRDDGGEVVSCRKVAWSAGGERDGVLIGPERVPVAGLEGLVAHLDRQLGDDGADTWGRWWRESRASGRLR